MSAVFLLVIGAILAFHFAFVFAAWHIMYNMHFLCFYFIFSLLMEEISR